MPYSHRQSRQAVLCPDPKNLHSLSITASHCALLHHNSLLSELLPTCSSVQISILAYTKYPRKRDFAPTHTYPYYHPPESIPQRLDRRLDFHLFLPIWLTQQPKMCHATYYRHRACNHVYSMQASLCHHPDLVDVCIYTRKTVLTETRCDTCNVGGVSEMFEKAQEKKERSR